MDEMIEGILAENQCHLSCSILEDDNDKVISEIAHRIHQAYLDANYVKLSDNQELPIRFLHPDDKPNVSYRKAQQDMLKANFRRVE